VEKELQEKAQAQLLMSGTTAEQPPPPAARSSTKREAGEGQRGVGEGQEEIQPPAPFNFVLDQQGATLAATEVPVPIQASPLLLPYSFVVVLVPVRSGSIRILPSSSKNIKKTLDFYLQKVISKTLENFFASCTRTCEKNRIRSRIR
jgi:hypothetical protein